MRRVMIAILVVLWMPLAGGAQTASKDPLEGFDAFVDGVLKDHQSPGLAVAVVRDGKVIHAKGYGRRNVEKNLPVTPQTLFAIGSISKSFTSTVMGVLADQGKLEWDKPVREYLPDFRLHDATATAQMTPRDLVTHGSGLPRHDALWYGSSLTRQQMYDRLRHLEPSKDFRSTWQYNNLMFMTAGYLAARLGDLSWEELVRQKIFVPLGMKTSNFSVTESQKRADFALPYQKVKEEPKEVPFRNIDEIGPAGSINSSVEEMAQYVLMHINKGKHGDRQILSETNASQMQTPQMVMPGGPGQFTEIGHSSYGMGWMISTYRGQKVVQHGGGIDGFTANLAFLPQQKAGLILLSNLGGNPASSVVTNNVLDRMLGLDQIAWNQRTKELQKKARDSAEEAKKKAASARKTGTRPSHELKEYAGEYEHPGYGAAKIEVAGEDLKLAFNTFNVPLKHYHYDYFEVPEQPGVPISNAKVGFLTNLKGEIDSFTLPLESSVKPITFARAAEKAMQEKGFLQSFVGEYTLGQITAKVELRDEKTLTLTVPGQPVHELVPMRGTSFDLKGVPGFSVEFKKDPSGAVTEMVTHQPNGTFVAKRK